MVQILIVDDHDLVRTGVRRLLEDVASFSVVGECESGEKAVDFCLKTPPEVVLMDVNMPGIGGIEAAKRILRRNESIKIIILTAQSENPLPKHLLDNGVLGYVTKSSGAQEMVRAINQVKMGQRYISDEIAQKMAMAMISGKGDSPLDKLSPREMEVLIKIAQGMTTKEIMDQMSISPKTISTHRCRIMEKLNAKNDVELARISIEYGLVDPIMTAGS
jgi:two-component system invasion response regulator UvrY